MKIIVTGAYGALGRAVCDTLANEGIDVIAIDHAASPPEGFQTHSLFSDVDLTLEASVKEITDTLDQEKTIIDGIVNIAGGFAWETLHDGSIKTWETMWQRNLMTTLNSCKEFSRLMSKNGGSIINIGAAATDRANAGMGAYTASKSAVSRLSEALSDELRSQKIRVNTILPTIIDTPANRSDMPDADFSEWVTPGQIANTINFLLSEKSSGITGAAIRMTG
ncbi:SDR family NAD(P)-dependent oxidoreductase [Kordiimonas sp. SCSIO 12610]|uniref:SDR family NAD(P)-dependent oxidoreductase n=1 Tax=Kordiimonas sp. SCSIO 12610 TaxID=2829597 RepID=UPI00210C7476|nr:SDR family NAD(P)-dependent oxidoreductase [Kordiimonas sp. SCSIO 12610]UTW54373.1 SDR family NAD(P)-dependent oxidoreductase [Kordiimonas sp. SCSIO 12610]